MSYLKSIDDLNYDTEEKHFYLSISYLKVALNGLEDKQRLEYKQGDRGGYREGDEVDWKKLV